MNRIACQYAIVRFTPFIETGEFANVGVVMVAAGQTYFGFKLETRRYARITRFFKELDARLFRGAMKDLGAELHRIRGLIEEGSQGAPDPADRDALAQTLFNELVRPRESIIRFSEPGVVLTANPAAKLADLFGYYVQRSFATRKYRETVLEERMGQWLKQWRVGERFAREQIGSEEYHATFPFVEIQGDKPIRILKPLHLGHDSPSKIIDHGGQWAFRLGELRRRKLLPGRVLFAVEGPEDDALVQDRRASAYRQAIDMLENQGIMVAPYKDRATVESFALER